MSARKEATVTRVVNQVRIHGPIEQVFDNVITTRLWPRWHPATISVGGVTERPIALGDIIRERARGSLRRYCRLGGGTRRGRRARRRRGAGRGCSTRGRAGNHVIAGGVVVEGTLCAIIVSSEIVLARIVVEAPFSTSIVTAKVIPRGVIVLGKSGRREDHRGRGRAARAE